MASSTVFFSSIGVFINRYGRKHDNAPVKIATICDFIVNIYRIYINTPLNVDMIRNTVVLIGSFPFFIEEKKSPLKKKSFFLFTTPRYTLLFLILNSPFIEEFFQFLRQFLMNEPVIFSVVFYKIDHLTVFRNKVN